MLRVLDQATIQFWTLLAKGHKASNFLFIKGLKILWYATNRKVLLLATLQYVPKGQLISKADWCAIDSPKKRTDKFVLFAFLLFTANKSNSSVRFLGESTARQSAFWFYLTFNKKYVMTVRCGICGSFYLSFSTSCTEVVIKK